MSRYYFHVKDGTASLDDTGEVSPRWWRSVRRLSGPPERILRDLGDAFWDHSLWTMWVTDESGATVLTLSFSGVW
jgi:hypothetical protein